MPVEYAPNDWRNPVTRKALKVYTERVTEIQDEYIKRMAKHINELGRLTASDVNRLEAMRKVSRDVNEVQRQIADVANISEDELRDIFEETIRYEGNDFLNTVTDANNHIPWEDNDALKTAMQAQVRVTQGMLQNFSNTRVVSEPYVKAVDRAILAVQSGQEDYGTAIRRALKQAASQGLKIATYETKYKNGKPVTYHRRLDSALRQNILDGVRDLAQESLEIIGKEFGADGYEISAHYLCAPDHLPDQGTQVTFDEFDAIQSGLDRPFGFWNCKHWWTPIKMDFTAPTYSPEELKRYEDYSNEPITIGEGDNAKTLTRYGWSQEQRKLETAIRQQQDIATAAKAAGDTQLLREARGRIAQLNGVYVGICDKTGLEYRYELLRGSGVINTVNRETVDGISRMSDSEYFDIITHREEYLNKEIEDIYLDFNKRRAELLESYGGDFMHQKSAVLHDDSLTKEEKAAMLSEITKKREEFTEKKKALDTQMNMAHAEVRAKYDRIFDPARHFKTCKGIESIDFQSRQSITSYMNAVNPKRTEWGNPNRRQYEHNCQRCVFAAELRFRGYDVIAGYKGETPFTNLFAETLQTLNNPSKENVADITAGKEALHQVVEKMREWGDGSRAFLNAQRVEGAGHIYNVVNIKGDIFVMDGQDGTASYNVYASHPVGIDFDYCGEISDDNAKYGTLVRVDNAVISPNVLRAVHPND